jgi:ABC-type phosphate/phosphonate transport system permease subunit
MSEQVSFQHDEILRRDDAARLKRGVAGLGLVVAILLSCWMTGVFDIARFADSWPAIKQLSYEMVPPDFDRWRNWLRPIVDTVAMSVAGTALAVLLSLPIALVSAQNTTPNALVYRGARLLLNLLRSVPELIMGIIFVAMVGFGALPGVLALGLHSVGMVGKFFAESIEHVDPKPIEAARAAGATPLQVIWHAVLPHRYQSDFSRGRAPASRTGRGDHQRSWHTMEPRRIDCAAARCRRDAGVHDGYGRWGVAEPVAQTQDRGLRAQGP